ncbi:hypothetical protein [Mycobacterium shigaense]|uniref:hypothetical protein n=1 Tax=Mycobacterium shigaense TaxID=722731 RepID=UPI001157878C|nr:hypothetical protein [Mycobacterium shigaense]MEA1123693.1 hypothetical protein [Mycobacterium shigaense]
MTNSTTRAVAAVYGGVAVFALVVGGLDGVSTRYGATTSVSSALPAPPAPGDGGGALPVKPVGGGGCVLGLNCGPIHPNPPPPPHRHPSPAPDPQHPAPGVPDP